MQDGRMGIITTDLFLTLDGVYQAPGGPEEDPTDGFTLGGWQASYPDDAIGESILASIDHTDALLLGRRTYEIFAAYWPFQPDENPVAAKFAAIPKYVVSRTLSDPSWEGTVVLPDASAAGGLREDFGEIHTWGSGELVRSLLTEGLVDRLNLWIYPIALGMGKRLFERGLSPAAFRPTRTAWASESGIMSLTLEPAGDVETGDMTAQA
jgi:dihydrofolate reductase